MDFKLSVWDITKSLTAVALVVFVWFHGSSLINSYKQDNNFLKEVTIQLEANKVLIQNLRESNSEAKDLINALKAQNGEQAKLIEYVTAENKKKDAKIEEVGVVVASLERTISKLRSGSDVSKVPNSTGDSVEDNRRNLLAYEMKKIYTKDAEGNSFPIAWAMYFPNQTVENRWKTGTYDIDFYTTVIESGNKDGTFSRAVEAHIKNDKLEETKGKEFPVKISDIKWEKFEVKEKSMYWWNPRVGLGGVFTNNVIAPSIDISISSYGKTSVDMDWRFLTLGFGFAKNDSGDNLLVGTFQPVSWNIGKALPLVDNIFVAPAVAFDSDSQVSYGIGVSVPF